MDHLGALQHLDFAIWRKRNSRNPWHEFLRSPAQKHGDFNGVQLGGVTEKLNGVSMGHDEAGKRSAVLHF